MILDKALAQVGGELIKVLDIRPAGVGTYPTAIVVVKRDAELHPYVTWRAIDSTCETLEEALQDPRKA
jgi:hypothetical protein